ncbi:MAG: glucosamine-6-phosphate deaminase [Spirochaetota bacterium]
MTINVSDTTNEMGSAAAEAGATSVREALRARGEATIIVATGASQFTMFERLVELNVDWTKVTAFHLDEYVGIDSDHPASFRRYLRERFAERLPAPLADFAYVQGDAADPQAECARLSALIAARTVDVAFVGIGENGHLAFNDPPADFETTVPYIVVELDEACRRQQMGEGWFETIDDVPARAISMSCREILRSRRIVCTVPDERKADAVACAVEGPVTPTCPASILQEHPDCTLYLDRPAASKLSGADG